MTDHTPQPTKAFDRACRFRGRTIFSEVYGQRVRREAGPLLVYARPNGLEFSRLGLSVGRRIGNAVRRNRVKRLLREAFRLNRDAWPAGYDWLIVVRPHEPVDMSRYARHLAEATSRLDEKWQKKTKS